MKLLFDQNLSFKLCLRLKDIFPNSQQVRLLGMSDSDDRVIWLHSATNDFIVVTQDSDFADMAKNPLEPVLNCFGIKVITLINFPSSVRS